MSGRAVEKLGIRGEEAQLLLAPSILCCLFANLRAKPLTRKIRDFRNTEGLAMVQIRYLGGFETKNEAFA